MSLGHAFHVMVVRNVNKVRAINRRYAKPRLVMSPTVRWALLFLRIYIFFLMGLIGYKFFTLVVK